MLELQRDYDGCQGILDFLAENYRHDRYDNENVFNKIRAMGCCGLLTYDDKLIIIERTDDWRGKFTLWIWSSDDADTLYYLKKCEGRRGPKSTFI